MHAIIDDEPVWPSEAGIAIPPELEEILKCCLEKKASSRCTTARKISQELADIKASLPDGDVIRTAPMTLERKVPRRGRWIAAAVASIAVLIAGGFLMMHRKNAETSSPASAAAPRIDTVAVLPFTNEGSDPDTEYLSDGLAESILYDLSRSHSLHVLPRSSVFRLKGSEANPQEKGRLLGAGAVLTGSLIQRSNRITVRAELIDVSSGSLLWGDRFDRQSNELIAVQQDIAGQVRQALQTGPSSANAPTADPEAFRLYLRGRYFWNKRTAEGLAHAAEQFQKAIDRDPAYALAWVGLGDSYALLDQYAGIPARENCPKAKAAILRAQQIEPALAQAWASLGLLRGHCDWDWPNAAAAFQRSIELDPGYATAYHWYALHLTYRGRFDEAAAAARRAQELDPLSLIAGNAISVVRGYEGRWDEVMAQSDRLIEMDPNFPVAHMWKGRALRARGDYDAAVTELQRAFDLSGARSLELMGELGSTEALAGRKEKAGGWLARLQSEEAKGRAAVYPQAAIYASLGDGEHAFASLDKAFEMHSWFLVQLAVEPLFEPLRKDPRFTAMVKRLNLEATSAN